jgi:mRNA-degrading endonuclease toxin of MazEF toxin-antitoxin module
MSDILCEQIRAIGKERLTDSLGNVSAATMEAVSSRLRALLGLVV